MRTEVIILLGGLAIAGCASSRPEPRPAPATSEAAPARGAMAGGAMGGMTDDGMMGEGTRGGMGGRMMGRSPMAVEGTAVRVEPVRGGAALVFTTTGDEAELRRRVEHAAAMMAAGRCPMMPDPDEDVPARDDHGVFHPGGGI